MFGAAARTYRRRRPKPDRQAFENLLSADPRAEMLHLAPSLALQERTRRSQLLFGYPVSWGSSSKEAVVFAGRLRSSSCSADAVVSAPSSAPPMPVLGLLHRGKFTDHGFAGAGRHRDDNVLAVQHAVLVDRCELQPVERRD